MASERRALVNPSSSCWSMIFSNPSIRKSKLISFCLTSAMPLIKSATRNLLSNYMTCIRGSAGSKGFLITATSLSLQMDLHLNLYLSHLEYLTISTSSQSEILQKDLDNLERWSHKWDMEFNHSKCQVIHITMSKNPISTQYTLHNCILKFLSSAKYLGVNISSDLSWDTHIKCISKKANNILGFLRRNI